MASSDSWLAELPHLRGARALDVATGSGGFARALASRYDAVWALDVPEVIARAIASPRVTFVAGDAAALPFDDGFFDFVGLAWSLHHLAHATAVLDEMRRVLAPGGLLLIEEPIRLLQGDNRDVHVLTHDLLARMDAARGRVHFPLYERLQVGSVIQGLGLEGVGFHPVLAHGPEADWDLATCREAGRAYAAKLETAIADADLAPWHAPARELLARLADEGLRTGPVMVVYGARPQATGALRG